MSSIAETAAERLNSLLGYVEQVVRLDERPAMQLGEYRLPTGQSFIVHQHQLSALPGVSHDLTDEDGPIWLRIERLRRGTPPVPSEDFNDWLDISPDPDREPVIRDFLIRTVANDERSALVEMGEVREEDCAEAPVTTAAGIPRWDVRLRLEDRPELQKGARDWIETTWLPWAIQERPVRKTLALYQRFFEVAQLAELGGGEIPFELAWGIGLARWKVDGHEIDLPLVERLAEIEVDEADGASIKVRPRNATANVNLRAFDAAGVQGVTLAYDAARRAMSAIDQDEGVTPYLKDSFEPVLRGCQARLDPEGIYLPDSQTLAPDHPPPPPLERLSVSDRWVIFARRRSDSFLLADLNNLKASIERATEAGELPGPARTLVMGPEAGTGASWEPLRDRIGALGGSGTPSEPDEDPGEFFFPKPFNDEQIEIVRRLKRSDGVVVQGPPGTGKTHTISNIICHAMATGQRVLVVSHGEPALAVLRDQLPDGIRDLAIGITTTEREGLKQVENAVRLLHSVIENIRPNDQVRLIRDLEASVVGLRDRLEATDQEIEEFAHRQLAPGLGGKRPAELASFVVASANACDWFLDRPDAPSEETAPPDTAMEALKDARTRLGSRLEHLDAVLPSLEDLPDHDMIARWHDDLQRARYHEQAAARDPWVRIRLGSLGAADAAMKAADALRNLAEILAGLEAKPWLKALAAHAVQDDSAETLRLVRAFADEAGPVSRKRSRYLEIPIELPTGFDAVSQEATAVVARLAAGEKVFGLLAFRERAIRPIVDAILVRGQPPASEEDWGLVRDFIAWRSRVGQMTLRWKALAEEIDAPSISTARGLSSLMRDLQLVLTDVPNQFEALASDLQSMMPSDVVAGALRFDGNHLSVMEQSLRNAAAAVKLSSVQAELIRLASLFGDRSGKTGTLARDFLLEAVGRDGIEAGHVGKLWAQIRARLDDLRQHAPDFRTVDDVTAWIARAGAPSWAQRLRTEPASETSEDAGVPLNWRQAWDWASAVAYLSKIDDKRRLRDLADERVRLDGVLRQTFEQLVRERTFYELGRSMNGPVRSALMMFAVALRQASGNSHRAERNRRAAQSAMAQCYAAIPCWIMPTWRVAEQLPGEVGTFDLVIMDEASQSDIRELPALLRGKKILVVGDDKQVSPSAAFIENAKIDRLEHNYLKEQPFKTLLLPGASLYDLAKVMFPDKLVMLREHFRCVEPIIRFSMGFYPEPLVPLRVPAVHERLDPPLVDIYVPDGSRTAAKENRREAEVILEEIRRIIDDPTLARIDASDRWRSIGVVSLIGAKQAALINRMILDDLGEEIVRRHRIACGDSATFQGNERDIIFLSMVADPANKQAQTALQFEQRFNVAMSRARDRLVLVRSVREEELKPHDLKARVIRHFKDPMAGAQAPSGDLEAMCESEFEREILRRLVGRGFRVTPQVGALGYRIDLVVEGTSGRRLAVECDGDKYHGVERWADDMRRQRVLERVGWRFWRCWGSSFTLDPDGCMEDLFGTLERMGIHPAESERPSERYTVHVEAKARNKAGDGLEASAGGGRKDGRRLPGVTGPRAGSDGIKVGDRVVIQYLDDSKRLTVRLTNGRTDLVNGLLDVSSPLGAELLGKTEDDEFEIDLDGRVRRILIIKFSQILKSA